ncbi:beta-galactosidase [Novosphingobium sp. CF614]|nr:beta-galactosidase [Novosphingobium sp. CF614]
MRRRELLGGALAAGALPLLDPAASLARGAAAEPESPLLHGLGPRGDAPWFLPQPDPSRWLLDEGWRFHEGDIVVPPPASHHETYLSVKAGNARGAAAVDWDDSDWPVLRLPHDWASAQPFVREANVSQGYRPRGKGWYRRTFRLDPADRGKKLELQFGGIATACTIWFNGSIVARNTSAYNAVLVDITPFARFGDADNVIAVRVDADAMEGWWYEGAGLYRHVWLAKRSPVCIATDGVHCDPRLVDGRWQVPLAVTLESVAGEARIVSVAAVLRDGEGREIARGAVRVSVGPLASAEARFVLPAGEPRLWSVVDPALYEVEVTLDGPDGADARRIPIGFRTVRFDAQRGFLLNGQPVKLKGVCLHQDHAGVGIGVPDALLAWRLLRLKDLGCNAIRCSHNAQAEEFYALCDRMGFLVMDENRVFNPAPENMAQLEWLVRAHRNHPCVVLWSVFNEEPMQGTPEGVEMVRRMRAAVRALDDSRPVTAAMNGAFHDPVNVSQVVDVAGFNYYPGDYDRFHAAHPDLPLTSSEDTSAYMTRGAYADDPQRHVISSMDREAAGWGATHRQAWREIARRPFVAGGFVWTGFDYHGEPTPYAWPTIASFFGILDLCGFAKTAYDIRRAQWIDGQPVVGIAPHWTWPGREGQEIDILVTSNAEQVRLRMNGEVIGEKPCDRIMGAEFKAIYRPGVIAAEALQGGKVVARAVHRTAGPAVALRLTATRRDLRGDGEDVAAFTVDTVDAKGVHVPLADARVTFRTWGGTLIGVGNGDPNCHESEKAPERSLFNGLAQLIVRADAREGQVLIEARAAGLVPARIAVPVRAAMRPPAIAPQPPRATIAELRCSPAYVERPDPALRPADGDNNLWSFVRTPWTAAPEPEARWRIYRAAVPARRALVRQGGRLLFERLAGVAELWVDGVLLARKADAAPAPLAAPLPPGAREIALLVRSSPGVPSGIAGAVLAEV